MTTTQAIEAMTEAGVSLMMTVIMSVPARSATNGLCALPGLMALPQVPAREWQG